MKIGIVDDSKIIRERLAEKLSAMENITLLWEATDIPEALEAISNQTPDILVLDINLPTGSGFKVLDSVKKSYPNIKVIVLTNFFFAPFKMMCKKLQGDYFIDKTNEFNKVFEIVRELSLQENSIN